ncbi:hypothetical protein LINPERHAP1_LOCUS8855 [Linum perenne]
MLPAGISLSPQPIVVGNHIELTFTMHEQHHKENLNWLLLRFYLLLR